MPSHAFKVRELRESKAPAWKKYASLTVGTPTLKALIKYEFIASFCGSVSGAPGIALRSLFYPKLLAEVGKNVVFGKNITIRHPGKIRIGNDVIIDDNCVLDAKGEDNKGIVIGNGAFVGRNTIIYCKNGDIDIGEKVNIGANCHLYAKNKLAIGKNTMVAAYCYLMSGGRYDFVSGVPFADQNSYSEGPTIVGDACWLGAKVVVQDGVTIGDGTVVGSGAIVTRDLPSSVVAVGVPARVASRTNAATR